MHGGREATDHPGEHRDGQREPEHEAIHLRRVLPWHHREHTEELHTPNGQHTSDGTAAQGQRQAFGQQLPNNPLLRCPERQPDRDLMLPILPAQQQQIRKVGAGNEEDEEEGALEQVEERTGTIVHLADGPEPRAVALVGLWILTLERLGDHLELSLAFLRRNTRFQARPDGQGADLALELPRGHERHEDLWRETRELVIGGHDTNHPVGCAVELERVPDERRIRRTPVLPERVADDRDLVAANAFFLGQEGPAERRLCPREEAKDVGSRL